MKYAKGVLLNDGGEGYIYEVKGHPGLLMKVYKEADALGNPVVTSELQEKLMYMKNNPPEVLVEKGVVAWPIDLLRDNGEITGFIMQKLSVDEPLLRVYSYRHPELDAEEFHRLPSIKSRISIGVNLCSALHELHEKGYVVGDFNHENIGVNYSTGQVYFMDCDSFHITDECDTVYRTNVIMAGYLAPEIIKHCNNQRSLGKPHNLDAVALPTFTKQSDYFCLSLHIFKLLMNGVDPFRGIKSEASGSTASPFVGNEAIERNAYVFRFGNKPSAVFCPPAEVLPTEILSLFNSSFIDGRNEPLDRPNEVHWYNALNNFLNNGLTQCKDNEKHQYSDMLTTCPYCVADVKHHKAQTGFIKSQYRTEPKKLLEQSSVDVIVNSKRETRRLHIITSLILWISTAICYFGFSYLTGYRTLTFNPNHWSGFELIFIIAAAIECFVERFYCKKELCVLRDNINLRELDPKNYDVNLNEYETKLISKIRVMNIIGSILMAAVIFVFAYRL